MAVVGTYTYWLKPPIWHAAKTAVALKRDRGIAYRHFLGAHKARLHLLPLWIDLRGGLAVDIGANQGDWVAGVTSAVPSLRAIAVEPYPPAYARLAERFRGARNVQLDQRAVGSEAGSATFHVAADDVFGSLLESDPALEQYYGAPAQTVERITVPTTTLDELTAGTPVNLLKIDVQGAELQVFEGAQHTLATTQAILIEANFAPQYKGGSHFREVDRALTDRGFALWDLISLNHADDGRMVWADALYVRPPSG